MNDADLIEFRLFTLFSPFGDCIMSMIIGMVDAAHS